MISKFCTDTLLDPLDEENGIKITGFLINMIDILPISNLNDIAYSLLRKLQLSANTNLQVHIYLAIEQIMKQRNIAYENCETLINELINIQPSLHENDKLVISYSQCIVQTLIQMNEQNWRESNKFIPTCISILQEMLLSENRKIYIFAQQQIELVIISTINSNFYSENKNLEEQQGIEVIENLNVDNNEQQKTIFQKITAILQHLLSSRFEQRQAQALAILGTFFQKIESIEHAEQIIEELVQSRRERPPQNFEKCFSKLITKIGASQIVKKFQFKSENLNPLDDLFEEQSNFWMLPLFLKYTKNQQIEDFFTYFIPHISFISTNKLNIQEYNQISNPQQRVWLSLFLQLWDSFPKFNIVFGNKGFSAFENIIDNIGSQLNDSFPHFNSVLKGLQQSLSFIQKTQTPNDFKNQVGQKCQQIIKTLHNILNPQKAQSKLILKTITSASMLAPQEYLKNAFNHNVKKLIENKVEKSKLPQIIKTFDMLNAVSTSLDFKNDRWELSMKLISIFLDENNILQKKAYKFLNSIMNKVHYTFLPQVMKIIQDKQATQTSARPARLITINQIWNLSKFDDENNNQIDTIAEFIQIFLPELIVGCRDSNIRSRKLVIDIFKKIGNKMIKLNMFNDFVSMISAGLGAVSSLMKADSIVAIGSLLNMFGKQVDHIFIRQVNSIILLLLKEQNKEIFKAILVYLKKYMKVLLKSELEGDLAEILKNIFNVDQEIRDKYRTLIKQIVHRLVKKFKQNIVEKYIPEEHLKIIKAVLKEEKNLKNKKLKLKILKKENLKYKLLKKSKDAVSQKKDNIEEEKNKEDKNLLLKYDKEEQQFHFVENNNLKKIKLKLKQKNEENDVEYLKGKIIVNEPIQDITGKKRRRENQYQTYDSILQEEREINQENTINIREASKNVNQKNNFVHNIKESGDTYKAKGDTGGDVIKKGKPDPYAFIQLNPKALNKRHQKKAFKAFDMIMNKNTQQLQGSKKVKQ
ncbi:pre-rRNA processing protein, putative [Ichthyophthirius multifiliis]|uniref:Pre-rRNA processing protein, putative n=1 Tax=Ichthyophthirius multifiliis TaxID=5932 RepID=G0QXL1_ICHMU|nr:pre-rRNA processing protein, putative [Ichthyophthirius multifiliis]EGR30041.1 pre-rRNA processing protein, putative [Ichthyophthirius multifiliis]|eukprot:XP_004031277.1 pre-rRNA processing protein, putative [Ichthyophthirius multifiliis]